MIVKSYEINKINPKTHNLLLFYGKNEGLKNYITKNIVENTNNIYNYDEKEVLDNEHNFIDNILTKSLFDEKKLIIVKRSTDKILKIIEKKLSVRQAENFVQLFKKNRQKSKITKDTNIIALELSISNKIGLNVEIQNNKRNKGKISFEYKDLDQLNKIINIIKSNY